MSGVVIDDAVRFGARCCLLLGGLAKGCLGRGRCDNTVRLTTKGNSRRIQTRLAGLLCAGETLLWQ